MVNGVVTELKFYLADVEALSNRWWLSLIGGAANEYFVVKNRDAWKQDFEEWLETSNRDPHLRCLMMNLRMKSTKLYHPKQEWLSKKEEEQDAKTKVGLNLTRNFRPATRRQWRPMQSCLGDE
jgi:hypothetical protein